MSGSSVGQALQRRFESIRRAELERLRRKLCTLSESEKASTEAIIADVIGALARVPASVLANTAHPNTLHAVVQLFGLEEESGNR